MAIVSIVNSLGILPEISIGVTILRRIGTAVIHMNTIRAALITFGNRTNVLPLAIPHQMREKDRDNTIYFFEQSLVSPWLMALKDSHWKSSWYWLHNLQDIFWDELPFVPDLGDACALLTLWKLEALPPDLWDFTFCVPYTGSSDCLTTRSMNF